jgi:hypothetical protein
MLILLQLHLAAGIAATFIVTEDQGSSIHLNFLLQSNKSKINIVLEAGYIPAFFIAEGN